MSGSVGLHDAFTISRRAPLFHPGETTGETIQPDRDARVESIRSILNQCGYTVTQLSDATCLRYGSESPYFIPVTFLYQLRRGVTPHICQIVALSENTGYRFVDWLAICGFDLQQIPRLQMRLHPERTVLVTPWEDIVDSMATPYGIHWNSSQNPFEGEGSDSRRFLFAKVGTGDALFEPRLGRGSIVRVDRCYAPRIRGLDDGAKEDLLWLVEQPTGLSCCRVQWIDDRQIVLLPVRPPWGFWPLRIPTEAKILGLVDINKDPRWLRPGEEHGRTGSWKLEPALPSQGTEGKKSFSDLLRVSRSRTGLTFREAQSLTRTIAQIFGNQAYAIALGLLSDYEAMGKLPRHIAKIMSLCMIYCMDIRELLQAVGVRIDDSTKLDLPMPRSEVQFHFELLDPAAHAGTAIL